MSRAILIAVRLHDGRYHGAGDWPPSPARLFQALVAGRACGNALSPMAKAALEWIEQLPPPEICVPRTRRGQRITNFVPNNDLDAKGYDPRRVGEIRTATKRIQPYIFDPGTPFLYFWHFKPDMEAERHANSICAISENLYQFGRGVDMAWA
ncbi:MAG: type I-G CRISPR-associated protein Csb2, partial [Pyrinomonadaceae bacterium]